MRVLREDEHRPFLKSEIEFGLVDLEHRVRRGERAVRGFAVVDVVVADLADRQLDHPARLPVRDDLVGFVCGEQAAVVHEAGLADQIERLRTESGARRADSYWTLPGRLRQVRDRLGEQPLLLRRVADTRPEFVDPSVDADLMRCRATIAGTISGWSMAPIAGMKNVAGTWCRSRRSRILGREVVAPYSPTDNGTGRGFARCSNSLSTSNERQTATRAPLGQVLGVSFLPTLAVPT